MSRWLIATSGYDIAPTQVTKTNSDNVVDFIEKDQCTEQQTPMKYDKNTYEGQEESNKVNIELQKAAMRK